MSSTPELRLALATRDAQGNVTQVRLVGAPGAWSLPRATVADGADRHLRLQAAVEMLVRESAPGVAAGAVFSTAIVLVDDPAPTSPATRVAVLDLPTFGVDGRDAIDPADVRALGDVLRADEQQRAACRVTLADRLVPAYEATAQRNVTHNGLMWQTPGLSMTAQAFLLTLALGSGTPPLARVVAASIAIVLSAVSVQLLRKHSHHEIVDRRMLERIELLAGWPVVHGVPPSSGSKFVDRPSRALWAGALWMFAAAAVLVIVAVALDAAGVTHLFQPAA
ncbi:MAG: hypothetical protein QM679_00675 [Patulibacter sp.]